MDSVIDLVNALSPHQRETSLKTYFREQRKIVQVDTVRTVAGWAAVLTVEQILAVKVSGKTQSEAHSKVIRSAWQKVIENCSDTQRQHLSVLLLQSKPPVKPVDTLLEATLRAKQLHQSLLLHRPPTSLSLRNPQRKSLHSLASPMVGFKPTSDTHKKYRSLADARLEAKLKQKSET